MKELLDTVRSGRFGEIPGMLKPLDAAERKALLAELKALRAELRGWGWDRWQERGRAQAAVLVAGAGCHSGAAAAAAWIGARDLRDAYPLPRGPVLDVLADKDPKWLGDLAHRLAGRASTAEEDYPLIHELVRLAKCPVPTTDGYVYGWVEAVSHARSGGLGRLRQDPHVRTLVPRLFETAELPGRLSWYADPEAPDHWPSVLAGLGDDGVVERSVLVNGCVSRLLRGGRPGEMRFLLVLLRRLALTPQEESARIADWIGMASDGTSTVAAHAQDVFTRLMESGALSTQALAELSGAVLFRTEKKLVRAQLVLLGKALRKDAKAAPELLPVVAEAFGHEDVTVQERALKLVARYLPATDDGLREELAGSAALLSPAHRTAAVEIFGALSQDGPADAYEEFLPPVPAPSRLAPAPESMPELVEDLMVVLRGGQGVSEFERTLDGLVRHIHRDPEPVAQALREALSARWWFDDSAHWDPNLRFSGHPYGVEVLAAALLGRVSVRTLHDARVRAPAPGSCAHAGLIGITNARLWEAAYFVRTAPLPFLLATPTWHTGALDPDVLVERLREYRRLGVQPAPVDFAQALLRVRRGGPGGGGTTSPVGAGTAGIATTASDTSAARAAADLGTPEGDRLAAWLSGEGPVLPALRPGSAPEPEPDAAPGLLQRPARATRRLLHETRERRAIQRELPKAFRWLSQEADVSYRGCHHWAGWQPQWPAVIPHEREALAAWMQPGLTACAADDLRGDPQCLPALAEADSADATAGPAMHRAVAAGLGARHAEDRLAAVDALLVLAARGQLDGALLGRYLAELVALGSLKPNRLAESARTAAATGAYATTWSFLATALPGLLTAGAAPRGLGEILAVAAECVERCGAAVPGLPAVPADGIPGLAHLAGRGGSSQLVAQASRLMNALRR
ncbi:DUF6493 family protein [Streptomyces sp. NPDC020681]|uniref:DUF7824 domain-containing protein n=1 Tax=Streptomyces sp. NPDC020681 TaxID=3365083 RepID=UPI0037AA3D08